MTYELEEYNDTEIAGEDFSMKDLPEKTFYNCIFKECNFTGTILNETDFDSCEFIDCNFTNPVIKQTKLNDVIFSRCKLMGLNFYECSQFSFNLIFSNCSINSCNFSDLKMKGSKFTKCKITDSYFQETFLAGVSFEGSNFKNTLFHNANLVGASFCNVSGYSIDPLVNNVRKAKFTVPDVLNLLSGFNIEIKDCD